MTAEGKNTNLIHLGKIVIISSLKASNTSRGKVLEFRFMSRIKLIKMVRKTYLGRKIKKT